MGTHPIFESDFDCLTEKMESDSKTAKKRFPCRVDGCGSIFTRKRNRNMHELGHEAKNLACDQCQATFQFPSQLKKTPEGARWLRVQRLQSTLCQVLRADQ